MMNLKKQTKEYDLKNDVIFTTFFSRKGNEEFLIDFLSALLEIEITDIEIREEVNLEKLAQLEKGGRLDLQARLNTGIIVNIEMQIENQHNIEERSLTYGAKTLSRHTKRGMDYSNIEQIIMINILNYEALKVEDYISETVTVLKKHRDYEVIRGMKWYFIELPKFRRAHPNMNEKINQWLAFIDNDDRGLVQMAEKKNKTLEKARVEMNYLTGDAEVRRLAELREKWERDYIDARLNGKKEGLTEGMRRGLEDGLKQGLEEGMKRGLEDGLKQGLEEGMKQGLEDGLKQGLEEGMKQGLEDGLKQGESKRNVEIAKEMLKKEFEVSIISQITKLTEKEIEDLKKK